VAPRYGGHGRTASHRSPVHGAEKAARGCAVPGAPNQQLMANERAYRLQFKEESWTTFRYEFAKVDIIVSVNNNQPSVQKYYQRNPHV
jgi:hypothetical protein